MPSKIALVAAGQATMRAPKPGELTTAQRAQRAAKGPIPTGLKGYDYTGGVWKNPRGVTVGRAPAEDSTITPTKSTGDTASGTIGPVEGPLRRKGK